MRAGAFVQGAKERKKKRPEAPKMRKYSLTKALPWCKMKVHTVILCPSVHSSHCEHLNTGCGGCQEAVLIKCQLTRAYQSEIHKQLHK